jgi:hypothetical protein
MPTQVTPAEVARRLFKIYEEPFGGKERGRFRISREHFRYISGRRRLEESTMSEIVNEAYEKGLVVTDVGDGFSVIAEETMQTYRKVPRKIADSIVRGSRFKSGG